MSGAGGARPASLPGARSALALLLFINLFNYIDRQVLAAVVPSIEHSFFGAGSGAGKSAALDAIQSWCRVHLGFKPELALIGVLSMAFMVLYMIGAPVFGRLAERHSRWALVGVGVVLWSLASGASGLAATFFGLLLTRCLVGVGEAAYGPVAPTILSDFYPVEKRGQVLAWFYMAIPVGSALGYVLGGAVAASSIGELGGRLLGIHAESWRWAFFLVVPPGLVLGLWAFFQKDPPRGHADGTAGEPRPHIRWRDYGVLLRTPSWLLCTLGMTAMTFAIGGIAFWMPYYLARKPGAPASATIIFGGITCVAGLVATLLGGMAGDRLRARFPGSYFLVSGMAMLAGLPVHGPDAGRVLPDDLGLDLPDVLLPLLQHRADQHDPRQRQPPLAARGGLRAQHSRHPRLRRRPLTRRHRRRQRPLRHEPRVSPGERDVRRRRRPVALRRAASRARHGGRPDAPAMTDPSSGGPGYALVRALTRFLLRLFYARIEVVGAENVPASGPLIVAANHHNSIVDAMILMAVIPRPVRILANAPLFRHPLIGPFLRLVGGLPVHRRKEAGNDPHKNVALFAATTAALRAGGAILIFPEGRTQPEPALQEIRTGTARMLLAAEGGASGTARVTLLPVGLVFDQPGTFRTGRALVLVGRPVPTADCASGDDAATVRAARLLTDRLADGLRAQIIEADDRHTLRLLKLVAELWRDGDGSPPPDDAARVAWMQRAMRTYRTLRERTPERVAAFRRDLDAYDAESERAGLAAERLSRTYSFPTVARYALTEGMSVLLAAPLALCGIVLHVIPYQLTAAAVRLIPHTDEEEATDKIAAGLVLYPVAWAAEAWAAWTIGGRVALAVFLIALLPTGFFALAWHERLEHVAKEARAFGRFLRDRDLPRRLHQKRQALAAELEELVRLAPEEWSSTSAAAPVPESRRSE